MKFINDRFKKDRGGYSRLLQISCEKCRAVICKYQKDGSGNLRRLYIDRVIDSRVNLKRKSLLCPKMDVLGVRIIYKKENRPAFRLFADAVTKKIIKL